MSWVGWRGGLLALVLGGLVGAKSRGWGGVGSVSSGGGGGVGWWSAGSCPWLPARDKGSKGAVGWVGLGRSVVVVGWVGSGWGAGLLALVLGGLPGTNGSRVGQTSGVWWAKATNSWVQGCTGLGEFR